MGDVLQALVLGVVQGLTEFLPVSSSGHLVLVPEIMGWDSPGLVFDVSLHVATLVALVAYFRRDLLLLLQALLTREPALSSERRLASLIIAATVPTAAIGLALDDLFERLFEEPGAVGVFLCLTALFLAASEALSRRTLKGAASLSLPRALAIGVAQGAAIAPGISRSGATIAAGMAVGLDREESARFSFLLSGPIILAATAKTALDALTGAAAVPDALFVATGFIAAAVTGYLAIAGLLAYLRNRSLYVFAAYTAVVGVAVVVWQYAL